MERVFLFVLLLLRHLNEARTQNVTIVGRRPNSQAAPPKLLALRRFRPWIPVPH